MRIEQLDHLPPEEREQFARELYGAAVGEVLDRLLAAPDLSIIPATPLYGVYRALATGTIHELYKTLPDLGRQEPGDEEVKREIARRIRLIRRLSTDVQAQSEEWARCKADPAYWIANWGWTRDPERDGLRTIPFVPFPRQVELIEWILERQREHESGYLNKGRKVGASYIVAFLTTWWLLFWSDTTVILSSYSRDALHKQMQPEWCIIEKIRVILRLLPSWQVPASYNEDDHFNFCSVVNPENGSAVAGILPNDENLRSTRASIAFLDEFPFYKDGKNAWTILEDVTPCRIAFGTPSPGSYATELCRAIKTFVFPWTDDPRKPRDFKQRWLAAGDGKTEADFAREHECNTDIAIAQTLIKPEWIDAAQRIRLQPSGETVCGLDPAGLGGDESALARRTGPAVKPLDVWQADVRETTERAVGLTRACGGAYLYFDASGLGSQCRDHLSAMQALGFEWHAIYAQNPPDPIFVGNDTDIATERYADQTTMLWFELAARLERTYRHFHGIDHYPENELLSLPEDDKLREQLLMRSWHWRNGKIKLDDKRKLSKSPDRADAVTLTLSTHLQRIRTVRQPDTVEVVADIDKLMGGDPFDFRF